MDWNRLLENFGFAVLAACGLAYAIWKMAVWISPQLEGLIAEHKKLVETLRDEIPKYREHADKNLEKLERIANAVEGNSARLDGLNAKLPDLCRAVDLETPICKMS